MHTSAKGMVDGQSLEAAQSDAAKKNTTTQDKVPHMADAMVLIAAKAGQATVAGQDIQVAANEIVHLASGQHLHLASGAAARIHTGQSIGVLAGAVKAEGDSAGDSAGKGITVIAGKGDVQVQAQASTMQMAAKQDVSIQSKSAHIDWAAAKRIVLQTAGGASVTLEGGNITVECPGKITVKAGTRSLVGPESQSYPLPLLPSQVCVSCLLSAQAAGATFASK
jgi:type VI secretion system secreted protein VgrG